MLADGCPAALLAKRPRPVMLTTPYLSIPDTNLIFRIKVLPSRGPLCLRNRFAHDEPFRLAHHQAASHRKFKECRDADDVRTNTLPRRRWQICPRGTYRRREEGELKRATKLHRVPIFAKFQRQSALPGSHREAGRVQLPRRCPILPHDLRRRRRRRFLRLWTC